MNTYNFRRIEISQVQGLCSEKLVYVLYIFFLIIVKVFTIKKLKNFSFSL